MENITFLSKKKHPNIVGVFEILEDEKNWYLVTEQVQGRGLIEGLISMKTYDEN